MTTPDPIALPSFLSADDLRSRTFARHVEIHDTLDSTNNLALKLSRDRDLELPALVVARVQTAGRGRGTNKWWSADGALTFSLLIDPAAHGIAVANWPQLSLTTAVAVCDAIAATSEERGARSENDHSPPSSMLHVACSIKWPNDVLLDNRKVAGILLESPGGAAPAKDRLVIGIGVNVNNSWRQTACGLEPTSAPLENATSLSDITSHKQNLQQILIDILHDLTQRISQLASSDHCLPAAWQNLSCLTNETITVNNGNRTLTGRCLGIADDGALLLQTDTASERIYSGSVLIALIG